MSVVAPVSPGPIEEDELVALLDHLLRSPELRAQMGAVARAHVRAHHDLADSSRRLLGFLSGVQERAETLRAAVTEARGADEGLLGYLTEEVRWGARDLGLPALDLGLRPLLAPLVEPAS